MPSDDEETTSDHAVLDVRDEGQLTVGGIVIGSANPNGNGLRIVLDLGWCKAAGVNLTVHGDRDVDRKRGPLLDR